MRFCPLSPPPSTLSTIPLAELVLRTRYYFHAILWLGCGRWTNCTFPCSCFRVKFLEQLTHNQKCSIPFLEVGNPKNLPPSRRISSLEHFGLAHFEIIGCQASAYSLT